MGPDGGSQVEGSITSEWLCLEFGGYAGEGVHRRKVKTD